MSGVLKNITQTELNTSKHGHRVIELNGRAEPAKDQGACENCFRVDNGVRYSFGPGLIFFSDNRQLIAGSSSFRSLLLDSPTVR